ncbi:LysE family translocator [Pseudomonas sp. S 311-6]|uniref:LysE family translocator n=1 Tax=Kerstersia gyiorum TaxID=206506 RepID=UPI0010711654|nr:LysE family translocator [Kerstersia gyiorum]MCO7637776.1 LysE family translocator [Pseudomonas sp. S 311-6]MCP1633109.1 threonine/homoserine/homoserine lactone efflux protein [Kerstersia gyiorum]MCP1636444.1 threonine/homoserine/homoserine lactone efflux protein [Kerstersia gyiorum]MCP1670303.1 threonine/homoserine/homoserine lactone efflux protein [Kerstersia gyiorum]MCP1682628.1 threonine/homoserine/homoserine lactone efflux protein [Kerstersia gyiorum]
MVSASNLAAFSLVALGMVITPGPNMIYLISRSIAQGRRAGLVSLCGVVMGFFFYLVCAACGLTALLLAVPYAYALIQWAGAAYLLYLAWQAVRPGGSPVFAIRADMVPDRPRKLFLMGFVTNLLNPKIAVLYLSLLPQFMDPAMGDLLLQGMTLGLVQIAISFSINLAIVCAAGSIAGWLALRPGWLRMQRWLMAGVLTALALRLATERR